jgi:hypothetical protein
VSQAFGLTVVRQRKRVPALCRFADKHVGDTAEKSAL